MQSVSSRIWTRVAVSISYNYNHYTTGTSWLSLRTTCRICLYGLEHGHRIYAFRPTWTRWDFCYLSEISLTFWLLKCAIAFHTTNVFGLVGLGWVLWDIIHCRLFNTKSLFIHISKVGDLSRGWPEGSHFDSY